MTTREAAILGLIGFSIWVSGAIGFRFGSALLFESGSLWLVVVAVVVSATVCWLLKAIMDWRKLPPSLSAQVAVALAWPALLADALYAANYATVTGRDQAVAGNFAAVIMAGNAALIAYAMVRAIRAA
jgi:hypothetical protein